MMLGLGMGMGFGGGSFLSPEAKAFITATGITDGAQKRAVDYLVRQLKTNNLYTKFSALYPFVGGSADTHKFNLINPVNSDAAFRIVWAGSVTHDANGIKSNGTNGYGDTKYNPVTASASLTSFSIGAYKTGTEANGTSRVYFGSQDGASTQLTNLGWVAAGSKVGGRIAGAGADITPAETVGQSSGLVGLSVSGNRDAAYYANGLKVGTSGTMSGNYYNGNFFILGYNSNGSPTLYTLELVMKLFYISTGLSDSEMATLNTIVTAYQTMLGRN